MYLGRYSVEKMLAFEEYQQIAGFTRVFAVIALTPIPGLIIISLMATIPLQSPVLGIAKNGAFFVQSWLAYTVMCFSLLLFIRCSLVLPPELCSHRQSAAISTLTAASNELLMLGVAQAWTFPIPFRVLLGIPSFLVFLTLWHKVILHTRRQGLRTNVVKYLKLLSAQASILVIFHGVSVVFMHSSEWGQAAITVGIPFLRAVLKRAIWRVSSCLEDISTDVSVCVVEIFGSLFQNLCLQHVHSPAVGALIIAVDFIQAVIETKLYLEHKFVVDGRKTTRTAVRILEGALNLDASSVKWPRRLTEPRAGSVVLGLTRSGTSISLSPRDVNKQPLKMAARSYHIRRSSRIVVGSDDKVVNAEVVDLGAIESEFGGTKGATTPGQLVLTAAVKPPKLPSQIDEVEIPHPHHAKILSQALQLVFASEVLVFAEYAEFACSVLYGLYTVLLYNLPYAKYNFFFVRISPTQLRSSVTNCATYAAFEGVSMLLLFLLVRAKYGFSTFHQLAFVLEKYWMTVQGKLVGSLAIVFILSTIHQGTDLTLAFNWNKLLQPDL
jgi:hypothetical protein